MITYYAPAFELSGQKVRNFFTNGNNYHQILIRFQASLNGNKLYHLPALSILKINGKEFNPTPSSLSLDNVSQILMPEPFIPGLLRISRKTVNPQPKSRFRKLVIEWINQYNNQNGTNYKLKDITSFEFKPVLKIEVIDGQNVTFLGYQLIMKIQGVNLVVKTIGPVDYHPSPPARPEDVD